MEGGRGSIGAHSPGLVIALVRSWVLAVILMQLSRGRPSSLVGVCCHLWAFVFTLGRSVSLVGVRSLVGGCLRWWAFTFADRVSLSLVGGCFPWWACVFAGGGLFLLVGGCFHWWGVVCVGGHSLLLVGICFRWWGVIWCGGKPLVAGWALPFMGICFRWWAVISVCAQLASLVAVHDVVAGGVVVRVRRRLLQVMWPCFLCEERRWGLQGYETHLTVTMHAVVTV